ncbi:unnamed protein product [Tetraodon nigroviridis]|uniref:(spotted green pufferfish) hypothetical protein n=1 Tax=Tetraodon nigroviridis TaxID=99883 RepID=Q4SAP4_TETNG|nr:unnamed protein product [Tetraodon nigroviridis]
MPARGAALCEIRPRFHLSRCIKFASPRSRERADLLGSTYAPRKLHVHTHLAARPPSLRSDLYQSHSPCRRHAPAGQCVELQRTGRERLGC